MVHKSQLDSKGMKKNHLLLFIGTLLLVISAFQTFEESPFILKLRDKLRLYNASYPEEKIYIQLDKPFYKPGEDIWFNVFLLNSNSHKASIISDVVYVELIDPKGNVAATAELVVNDGTANGDFLLQEKAPGGLYQIRSYTLWMKNFGKESFFTKQIPVQRINTPRLFLKLDFEKEAYGPGDLVTAKLNVSNLRNEKLGNTGLDYSVSLSGNKILTTSTLTEQDGVAMIKFQLPDTLKTPDGLLNVIVKSNGVSESISRSIPIVLNKINLSLFPEGGQYVENVKSRIAFKSLNEFGKGADIVGVVVDKNNNQIIRFESLHMGMGSFEFTPIPGEKYSVLIEKPIGNKSLIPLPDPKKHDFVLNLKSKTQSSIEWLIDAPTGGEAFLIGNAHGEIVFSEKLSLSQGSNQFTTSTDKLPIGITVFTLFDSSGNARCERLVFLNKKKGLRISITSDKEKYLPREPVDLKIKTTDYSGNPIKAKVSLSVVDDKIISFADDKQDNLLSAILLSSEIKGEIQEPSFYFDTNEPKAEEALDHLLMTQGWRRSTWNEVLETKRIISYAPEKIKNIGGTLHNEKGIGYSSEVTLLELSGRKRIVRLKTTVDGHFIFKNIDPKVPVLLLTKKPGQIVIQKNPVLSVSLNDKEGTVILSDIAIEGEQSTPPIEAAKQVADMNEESGLDLSLGSDVTQLSEIIVTGMGVEEARGLAGSVVRITENASEGLFAIPAIEGGLQGRVAGILVQPQTGNPGAQTNVIIRGSSSFGSGRGEPLYIIDGHPVGTSLSQNFSNGSMIGPEDIQSIEVINTPEMTALYGSSAANGVILITTKSRLGYVHFSSKKKPAKYSSVYITPRKFSQNREFYIAPPAKNNNEMRKDFRTTVYWNHTVLTDDNGNAKLSFYNNDAVSAFRITAEGFSGSGLIGRNEHVYYTQLPLSLDAKLPEFLGFEDILELPVTLKNETSEARAGNLSIKLPDELELLESPDRTVTIPPRSTETILFTIKPKGVAGDFPISIKLESVNYSDAINHKISVRPVGFPVRVSYSAKEVDKVHLLSIKDAETNSIKAELTAFPDILNDLFTGAESILQEPHGCFEQVSSSTFPNILALQFLNQSGLVNAKIEKQALGYIKDGYKRLVAYEIKGGGFEWFGHPPAHEGLTAYGLVQFNEMKKVYAGVDSKMMERTIQWILSRRDGKGGFKQNAGKYGFSGASANVTNAYIVYALSEIGTKDILPEYNQALSEVLNSNDMYRMALMACAAFNLSRMQDYERLTTVLKERIKISGFSNLKAEHSIVRSYGNSLQIETVAQWAVALMKPSSSYNLPLINECIQHILKGRSYGQFGSTQGTAIALKALTEYAKIIRTAKQDGEITILIDNKMVERLNYKKDDRNKMVLREFAKSLNTNKEQELRVRFNGTGDPLPYSVDIQWHTKLPQSRSQCKVSLTTSLSAESVKVNETVRLTAILKNKTKEGLPMTVAIIGIPAGLSVQPWQLKELQEKRIFDFYEISNGNVVIYYRELAPEGQNIINFDLKAEIPGSYLGSASSAYLYYTNEFKEWVKGNSISIAQ